MLTIEGKALAVAASCSIVLASLAAYFVFQRRRKVSIQNFDTSRKTESPQPLLCVTDFQKENLAPNVASAIRTLLSSSDFSVRQNFLLMLHQASAFSSNFTVIRDSGCLESMLSLLDIMDCDPAIMRQNLIILQTVTNLACDHSNLEIIENYFERIFAIGNTIVYSDQACAALQLLCNIALTPKGCRLLDDRTEELYKMLLTRDPYMLRQVLSVLLNLSCDATSSILLLQTLVPEHLMETVIFTLSPAVQPLVSVQAVTLLKNLYNSIRVRDTAMQYYGGFTRQTECTMQDFLLNARVQIKLRLFLLLSEPATSDMAGELVKQSEELCSLLETHFGAEQRGRPETR